MEHYKLGEWLRNRYNHMMNGTYSRDIVYVQSTDVDRTLMSAESNLAGLFPPLSNERWNVKIDWQPIPVHTIPEKLDEVIKSNCCEFNI